MFCRGNSCLFVFCLIKLQNWQLYIYIHTLEEIYGVIQHRAVTSFVLFSFAECIVIICTGVVEHAGQRVKGPTMSMKFEKIIRCKWYSWESGGLSPGNVHILKAMR